MGAYKDANGKTRVGTLLSSVGGFFKGIFSKKSTSTSTSNNGAYASVLTGVDIPSLSNAINKNNTTNTTPTTGGATPGINGNTSTNTGGTSGGGWLSSVLIGVGLPALSEWLKSKGLGGSANTGTTTTDNQTGTDNTGTGRSMSSPNTGLVIGIILVILAIASFFIFRRKK